MRKAINENPVVQAAVLGVLGIVVAFMLLTRVSGGSSGSSATTPTDTAATASSASTTPSTASSAPATAAPSAPSTTGTVAPSTAASGTPSGTLVAGPGLPKPVANAYADGKAIVLLVFRHRGIDDAAVRNEVEHLKANPGLAVFVIPATQIGRFSRIAEGVSVDRVPALIVVKPKRLSHGTPTASVGFGFRSAESIDQAIRNALYKGPTNLPYYPR